MACRPFSESLRAGGSLARADSYQVSIAATSASFRMRGSVSLYFHVSHCSIMSSTSSRDSDGLAACVSTFKKSGHKAARSLSDTSGPSQPATVFERPVRSFLRISARWHFVSVGMSRADFGARTARAMANLPLARADSYQVSIAATSASFRGRESVSLYFHVSRCSIMSSTSSRDSDGQAACVSTFKKSGHKAARSLSDTASPPRPATVLVWPVRSFLRIPVRCP